MCLQRWTRTLHYTRPGEESATRQDTLSGVRTTRLARCWTCRAEIDSGRTEKLVPIKQVPCTPQRDSALRQPMKSLSRAAGLLPAGHILTVDSFAVRPANRHCQYRRPPICDIRPDFLNTIISPAQTTLSPCSSIQPLSSHHPPPKTTPHRLPSESETDLV